MPKHRNRPALSLQELIKQVIDFAATFVFLLLPVLLTGLPAWLLVLACWIHL